MQGLQSYVVTSYKYLKVYSYNDTCKIPVTRSLIIFGRCEEKNIQETSGIDRHASQIAFFATGLGCVLEDF